MKDHSATDLAEHAAKAALAAGGVAPELVNSVIMGNVMQVTFTRSHENTCVHIIICVLTIILSLSAPPKFQSSADAPYIARHVGLRCGVPIPVPALTVNRLCGSGFQAVINGAQVSSNYQLFLGC